MHIAEQLRLAGVPTFPCGVRYDTNKNKWLKWPATPVVGMDERGKAKHESWFASSLRPYNDPQLDWSSGVAGVPIPAGVVVIDLDLYKGVTREAVERVLGCTLAWDAACIQTTISRGEHYAFSVDWEVKQADSLGLEGFDTRAAGKGFICTGAGYSPVNFGILALAYPASLPRLPDACRHVLEVVKLERVAPALPVAPDADMGQILEALKFIDPGCSRAKWLRIGMALRHQFHSDDYTGMMLFDQWSAGQFWKDGTPPANYVAEHISSQWPSFKPEGATVTTTIATLFYEAMRGGWNPPVNFDTSGAFGTAAADSTVYLGLLERIIETGGDVRQTQDIIDAIRSAGCNALQVALLAAELKNALKDAGIKDSKVNKHIDTLLTPAGPTAPRQQEGFVPPVGGVLDADTPLHPSMWAPMQTKGKDMKPKGTQRNFEIMMESYGVIVTYDEISKNVIITGPSVPGEGTLHDEAALAYLDSLANLNEYPTASIRAMVMIMANRNTVNPVIDWVHSVQWDGYDHVGALFGQVQLEPDEDPAFCELLFRKWLRGAYGIGTGRLKSWEYCLVFVDPYGGAGKTRFFSTLTPPSLFAKGVILDLANKDSIKMGISYWITELGELDGTFSRSDQNKLKAFMSLDFDELRLPYGRSYLKYPRRTAFLASVNEPQFFVDLSNNRRFWAMAIRHANHLHTVNVQQMWAQVAHEVMAGAQAHLTPQEDQTLFARNEQFRTGSGVADKLSVMSMTWGHATDKYMTTSEILALAGHGNPSKSDLNEAARWLRRTGVPFGRRGSRRGFLLTLSGPQAAAFVPQVVK